MTATVRFHETGGPGVLRVEQAEVGAPGPGEVRVRHSAIGLNFIDTYHRSGLYPVPALPCTPGLEAAGVVDAVGPGVTLVAAGDRVAYATGPLGAYCGERVMPEGSLLRLPAALAERTAASVLLKGLTASYLLRQTFRVERGHVVVIQAAAGGVGLLACQWAAALGATVIGVVGSEAKAELARRHGCEHVLVLEGAALSARVREITHGRGAEVVYDGVGRATFASSLDCLARRGMLVSFGNASGPVDAFAPALLGAKGSLFVTRPRLHDHVHDRAELETAAAALFEMVTSGAVRADVITERPLAEAAAAHADLEARRTTGSTVLVP